MRRSSSRLRVVVLAIALTALAPVSAQACPNCREALSAQPTEASRLADGFNWSILLMLTVPASLFCVGGFVVRRAVLRGVLPEM